MSIKRNLKGSTPLVPVLLEIFRKGYSLRDFGKDISAGITVGVVALPLALAFAIASGLGPERGLYTGIVAGFFMALFGGSRFTVSGPTGAFVVLVYSVVSRYGYDGLALCTFMAGGLLVLFGLLRLGSVIKYIPFPVTTGFTFGIALLIFSSQMKDFFGLPLAETPPEFFDKWHLYATNAMQFSPSTVLVAVFTLALILGIRRCIPRLPAPVVAVAAATLLVAFAGLPVDTIGSRYGTMPTGLPSFYLPDGITIDRIRMLFPDAMTLALLAGIESLLACVVADSMSNGRHNSNMELIAQGIGNAATALFGGFAATGAIARTATNVRAGAVSPIAAIVHVALLMFFLLWFMPIIEYVPLAALAAVLVRVAWDMSDWRTIRHMFQGPKSDWSVMLLTFGLTVVMDLTVAVYTGVLIASLLFMRRMSELTRLGTVDDHQLDTAAELDLPIANETVPEGVQVFSITGPLFFGVADRFQNVLDAMEYPPQVFIMYLHNVPAIDMTGVHALESFLARRKSSGCTILLADMQEATRNTLEKAGILRALGKEAVFPTLHDALERSKELVKKG